MIFFLLDKRCSQWYFLNMVKRWHKWDFLYRKRKCSQWYFIFLTQSVINDILFLYKKNSFLDKKGPINQLCISSIVFECRNSNFSKQCKKNFQDSLVEMTALLLLPKLAGILSQNRARSSQTLLLSFSWQTLSSPFLQNNPQPAECQKWLEVVPHW